MLSGICPRGSSSAPGNGNTGITSGSSPGPRYSALIGMSCPGACLCVRLLFEHDLVGKPLHTFPDHALGEQDRRQSLSSFDGRLIGAAPRLEELHQLLARAVVVPFAVTLDDLEQLRGRLRALALRVQRGGKVEARLMIEWVCIDFLFKLGDR